MIDEVESLILILTIVFLITVGAVLINIMWTSTRSPGGTVKGLPEKSPFYEDYIRNPSGLPVDSVLY
jgi:hypothetical protein